MSIELGRLCTLMIGSKDIMSVKDVKVAKTAETADSTSRDNEGWKGKRQGLKEWSAQFECLKDDDDTGIDDIESAYMNGTVLVAKFRKASEPTTVQEQGNCYVIDFSRSEPLSGVVSISVTLEGDGPLAPPA